MSSSTPSFATWADARELVKDAGGAFAGLYIYKGKATAMHHVLLYMAADAAYVFMLRAPVLDRLLTSPPARRTGAKTVNWGALDMKNVLIDYGAKLVTILTVDLGWELLMGRDAIVKKIIYCVVMGISGLVVNVAANRIDEMLPTNMQGYIDS